MWARTRSAPLEAPYRPLKESAEAPKVTRNARVSALLRAGPRGCISAAVISSQRMIPTPEISVSPQISKWESSFGQQDLTDVSRTPRTDADNCESDSVVGCRATRMKSEAEAALRRKCRRFIGCS